MDIGFSWLSIQKWNFFPRCDLAAARKPTCFCPPGRSFAARWALQDGGRSAQVKCSSLWEMLWVCSLGGRYGGIGSATGDCGTLGHTDFFPTGADLTQILWDAEEKEFPRDPEEILRCFFNTHICWTSRQGCYFSVSHFSSKKTWYSCPSISTLFTSCSAFGCFYLSYFIWYYNKIWLYWSKAWEFLRPVLLSGKGRACSPQDSALFRVMSSCHLVFLAWDHRQKMGRNSLGVIAGPGGQMAQNWLQPQKRGMWRSWILTLCWGSTSDNYKCSCQ